MLKLDLSADQLVSKLLMIGEGRGLCLLDSCAVGSFGTHLLIAGLDPVRTSEFYSAQTPTCLDHLDRALTGEAGVILTLSYEFGADLVGLPRHEPIPGDVDEPDLYLSEFDVLVFHDYASGESWISGRHAKAALLADELMTASITVPLVGMPVTLIKSNFSRSEYCGTVETIKELIRSGETYQTNLTQQLCGEMGFDVPVTSIFQRLRDHHPSTFSAYLHRPNSTVISVSPELFFKVDQSKGTIRTAPIKGTRARGANPADDARIIQELLSSTKDRAENLMIVDLLRNDLGRVCEYGSVRVEDLCNVESHPTFHNLVSTIVGKLKPGVSPSEILKALFPCGSITGAPKISTMKIIRELEDRPRGLSMGAIGCYLPDGFGVTGTLEMSVAIRTMTISGRTATFNVGGGIVSDSDSDQEYEETLIKAKGLLTALNGRLESSY